MAIEPKDAEQRRILRELKQQGQATLTWGLPNPATEAAVIGVGLLMRDQLAERQDGSGASKATKVAAELVDQTVGRMPQAAGFACRAGCSFCCHSAVAVSAPEAFGIARMLTEQDPPTAMLSRDQAVARSHALRPASLQATLERQGPCAYLVDDRCSVHSARPISCRQYVSLSVEACEAAFNQQGQGFPYVNGAANVGNVSRSMLLGAARSLELDANIYELASAVAVALETPDAERRWLAGEDVLAGALRLPQPPQMQTSVERWSPMLKTFAEGV
ncbi:MAG: YkgJ family cysteine cluster protein [Hyphomicrobiaceae bacterium]